MRMMLYFGFGEDLCPQDFVHGFSFDQLVDQLVEIPNFPHQRFLDIFDSHSTNSNFYFISVFIHLRSALKKRLVVNVLISLEIQFLLAVSGEPVNDFIYLIFCAVFTDAFMDKERVDFREGHLISVLFLHHSSLLAVPIFRPDGFADRKDSFPK